MKSIIILAALGCIVTVFPYSNAGKSEGSSLDCNAVIGELLQFFVSLPIEEMIDIVQKHMELDNGLCSLLKYVQSEECQDMLSNIESTSEVQAVKEYLTNCCIPVDLILAIIPGLLPSDECSCEESTGECSLKPLLDELSLVLAGVDVEAWLENSENLQPILEKIKCDDFRDMVVAVMELPEVKALASESQLCECDMAVDDMIEKIFCFFGWDTSEIPKICC